MPLGRPKDLPMKSLLYKPACSCFLFRPGEVRTKPCEIDELVDKIEGAWEKKNEGVKKDIQDKIQEVVELPSSVFHVFPKGPKKKG